MGQLKYLSNKDHYLNLVFSVWGPYFPNKRELNTFFDSISSDEEKDLFLRIGSFYKFLVKEGTFSFRDSARNRGMQYIDDSYKYIAIFSLIEALYVRKRHLDFFEYLMKNKKQISFNISQSPTSVLSAAYKQYKDEFGAQQLAMRFFNALDEEDKKLIQRKLRVHRSQRALKKLVQLLYQMRSLFVHQAKFVLGFGEKTAIGRQDDDFVVIELTMNDIQMIFEHGFLKRFGGWTLDVKELTRPA